VAVRCSQSLQTSLRFLDSAFEKFFHNNAGHPKFRKKGKNDCFAIPQHVRIKRNRICFPKFKEGIRFRGSEEKLSEIKDISQIVIKKDAGDYCCSIACEMEEKREKAPLSAENSVGIDLGVEKFAALSDGAAIENPRFIEKVEEKIKRMQRQLSKKERGSNNRRKLKLQRKYKKLRYMREDFLDKVSTATAKRYDTTIEDLNVRGMQKDHRVAKSVGDASLCFQAEIVVESR